MTQAFNLSQLANNVNTSGQLNAAAGLYNQVPVANGGTGASALTGNGALIMNAAGTALTSLAAGTAGNVLTSNGITWESQTAGGAVPVFNVYTTPGTWTKPATIKGIKVTVIGSGGGGFATNPANAGAGGGGGGYAQRLYPAPSLSGPQPYTAGAAVAAGASGNSSSFGVAPTTVITATGGGVGSTATTGPGGNVSIPANGGAGGVGSNGNANGSGGYGASGGTTSSAVPIVYYVRMRGAGGVGSFGYGNGGQYASGSSVGAVIIEEFY